MTSSQHGIFRGGGGGLLHGGWIWGVRGLIFRLENVQGMASNVSPEQLQYSYMYLSTCSKTIIGVMTTPPETWYGESSRGYLSANHDGSGEITLAEDTANITG